MFEVDILISIEILDGRRNLIIVRCNGSTWHEYFGIPSNYDLIENNILNKSKNYIEAVNIDRVDVVEIDWDRYRTEKRYTKKSSYIDSLIDVFILN